MGNAPGFLNTIGRIGLLLGEGRRHIGARRNIISLVILHVKVILVVLNLSGLCGGGEVVLLQGLVNALVVLHFGQALCVDGLRGVLLLDNTENTIVQVLVEVLSIGEGLRTSTALASSIRSIASKLLARVGTSGCLLAAVGGSLLDTVDGGQVPLEDIGAVERLLRSRAGSRTETAHHGTLVVSQGVAVLVVLASEALDVILAGLDGTLLGSLVLVGEHVCLEVLEDLATVRVGASLLLLASLVAAVVLS